MYALKIETEPSCAINIAAAASWLKGQARTQKILILISGKNYEPIMHAIECRINAEDPYNDFRPSPGKITVLHTPGGHGVRVDSHVYAGYVIPPYYDSMIGKLITIARTREEAIDTMYRALSEYVIEGIKTTIPFHLQLMQNEDFRKGNFTTKFLETFTMK